jgi:hypothetical protein
MIYEEPLMAAEPEDGGIIFHRNEGKLLSDYTARHPVTIVRASDLS